MGVAGYALFTYNADTTPEYWARWTFDLTAIGGSGAYKVEAFIPRNTATTRSARYHLNTASGLQHKTVDQSSVSDAWVDLGTYGFVDGASWIQLDDATGEPRLSHTIGVDAVRLLFVAAVPTVTSLSPAHGPTAAGTFVTINGANFLGATAVNFGGVAATNVTVVSSTVITCRAPAHASSKVDVTVTTLAGTSTTSGAGNDYIYTTCYQQSDPRLLYSGTWSTIVTSSASGSSYKRTNASGAYVIIQFSGTRLYLLGTTGPSMGDASISVDGKTPVTVHFYNATVAYRQNVWNTGVLSSGKHIAQIKRNATSGKYISVDALEVVGSLSTIPATTTCQESSGKLNFSSGWSTRSSSSASAGKYKYTNTGGARVTFSFTGVQFSIRARKAPDYGKLSVTIDGGTPVVVDLYAASPGFVTAWSSPFVKPGAHTVVIRRTGAKNGASNGYTVSLDALSVRGTVN